MSAVTATDLGTFLGRTVNTEQAESVIGVVTSLARSYTRGAGFTDDGPNEEIASVILTASARLLAHPRQLGMSESVGPQSAAWREGFTGWSTAELFCLNRYRVTAR